ncbi:tripartite tricarboxylate transporter substrate binding protein [Zwartia sp.]|uniref:Bug family tripartite tricarboxylate transporter substrate binding protein n=1 Tax=Zwartia sp. TaxID=2978004 RepID=UPI0027165B3F|nr:tripartite tricarboxylate transporter substrate binding protein [Zwartia sp.]MDO9023089.1 tripartite tricarboxylate transporter substrate binding protein [Zwartia sp.]
MLKRLGFIASGLLLSVSAVSLVHATDYPDRQIQFIVPNGPGGGTDTFGRVLAQKLSEVWNQRVVVDNRPGAQAAIGTALGAKAAPDGYTLTIALTSSIAINPFLSANLGYDPLNDFVPVAIGVRQPFLVVTSVNSPYDSLKQFSDFAKKKSSPATFASTSSQTELVGSLFGLLTDTKFLSVPYKNASTAVVELARGDVDMMVASLPSSIPLVNAGKLKAIAVTGTARVPALPNIKTSAESGYPDFLADSWYGVLAPKGTPKEIVDKLNKQINLILDMPDVQKSLATAGMTVAKGTPEEFGAIMRADHKRWGDVIARQKANK